MADRKTDKQIKNAAQETALLIPLIAAGIWAAFLITTKGSTDPNLKLSPSNINDILLLLLAFSVIYTIFIIGFLWYRKRLYQNMMNATN